MMPQEILLFILSVFGIFTLVYMTTRFFGLKTFARVSNINVASALAVFLISLIIIMSQKYSLKEGALLLTIISLSQISFSYLIKKNVFLRRFFYNKGKIVMWNGKILNEQLKSCSINEQYLIAKLKEANVHNLREVKAVILETTGNISIVYHPQKNATQNQILS